MDWHTHFIAKPDQLIPSTEFACSHAWPCWENFQICAQKVKSQECNNPNRPDDSHGYFYIFLDIGKGHRQWGNQKELLCCINSKTTGFLSFPGRWESTKELIGYLLLRTPIYTPRFTFVYSHFIPYEEAKSWPLPNSVPTRAHPALCKGGLKHWAGNREDDKCEETLSSGYLGVAKALRLGESGSQWAEGNGASPSAWSREAAGALGAELAFYHSSGLLPLPIRASSVKESGSNSWCYGCVGGDGNRHLTRYTVNIVIMDSSSSMKQFYFLCLRPDQRGKYGVEGCFFILLKETGKPAA